MAIPLQLRPALRSLARTPGFTVAVLATFALGIGVNTAVFSAAWSALWGPLPLEAPDRLVAVWETFAGNARREVAPGNFMDIRREAKSLAGAAAYFQENVALDGGAEPRRISAARVSTQFFDVLRPEPLAGRFFHGGERGRLAVVSAGLWKQELGGGAPDGLALRVDGESYEVVGVAPASFALPSGTDAWLMAERDVPPLPIPVELDWTTTRDARYLGVYARLAPAATVASADSEVRELAARLETQYPEENKGCGARVVALAEDLGDRAASPMALLGAGALAVLLLTCANVAGLVLARGLARRRELAVRAALGAGGAQLLGASLVEVALLATAGGAAGLALAAWGAPRLVALLPGAELAGRATGVTAPVALVATLLSLVAALAAAATPGLAALKLAPAEALAGARGAAGVRHGGARTALVVAQAALAVLLVASALLVVRTLSRLVAIDPGFDGEQVTTMRLWAPTGAGVGEPERGRRLAEAVAAAATAPGVERAGAILKLPLTGTGFSAGLTVEGREFAPGQQPDVCWRAVTGDYFGVMGIATRAGRTFESADGGSLDRVAVINETLARQIWPGEDPVGRNLRTGLDGEDAWVRVVGVVADTPQSGLTQPVRPEMYRPLLQPNHFGKQTMALVVKTGPGFSAAALQRAVRDGAPGVLLESPTPASDLLRRATARERLLGSLLGSFAAAALALAGLGLYGVLALLVAERRRELGIRLAVGATAGDLRRLVLGRGVTHVLIGMAIGLPAALLLARAFRSWLWEVSPADPASLGGAVAALAVVAGISAWLPARRAARVDPVTVLRDE